MRILGPGFRPAPGLGSPHLQTVWGRIVRPRRLVSLRREVLTTPDEDELILDHLEGSSGTRFLLLHGLEGSSSSVYIQGLLSLIASGGHAATAINFRSCARAPGRLGRMIPNRRPRLYHSGETEDLEWVVRTLSARHPDERLVAFGGSLGGNVLLKWLGEHPEQEAIRAAVTVSVPYDLEAGGRHLETILGEMYVGRFLNTLRRKVVSLVLAFPETAARIDPERALSARSFLQFDDAATAPLHGFEDAHDYYARSSSLGFVHAIRTPTLCISAADDPFLPHPVIQRVRERASSSVTVVTTDRGGHLGFIGGSPWRPHWWAEHLAYDWLVNHHHDRAGPL